MYKELPARKVEFDLPGFVTSSGMLAGQDHVGPRQMFRPRSASIDGIYARLPGSTNTVPCGRR